MIPQRDSKCENCRWYRTIYNTKGIGNWYVYGRCLMGWCDGSQYEPKDGKMDEDEVPDLPQEAYYNKGLLRWKMKDEVGE